MDDLRLLQPHQPAGDQSPSIGESASVSLSGHLGISRGCRVILFCESLEQCKWLHIIGFTKVFNSKRTKTSAVLQIEAPDGIDFYFDCAGSAFTLDVLSSIRPGGTVCVFGQNAAYEKSTFKGHRPDPYHMTVMKDQQVYNDSLTNHTNIFTEAQEQILYWIQEGKLQYKQEIFCGFEKLPLALGVLYEGGLVGKIIVMSSSLEFCSRCDKEKCIGSSGDGITLQSALY